MLYAAGLTLTKQKLNWATIRMCSLAISGSLQKVGRHCMSLKANDVRKGIVEHLCFKEVTF